MNGRSSDLKGYTASPIGFAVARGFLETERFFFGFFCVDGTHLDLSNSYCAADDDQTCQLTRAVVLRFQSMPRRTLRQGVWCSQAATNCIPILKGVARCSKYIAPMTPGEEVCASAKDGSVWGLSSRWPRPRPERSCGEGVGVTRVNEQGYAVAYYQRAGLAAGRWFGDGTEARSKSRPRERGVFGVSVPQYTSGMKVWSEIGGRT